MALVDSRKFADCGHRIFKFASFTQASATLGRRLRGSPLTTHPPPETVSTGTKTQLARQPLASQPTLQRMHFQGHAQRGQMLTSLAEDTPHDIDPIHGQSKTPTTNCLGSSPLDVFS